MEANNLIQQKIWINAAWSQVSVETLNHCQNANSALNISLKLFNVEEDNFFKSWAFICTTSLKQIIWCHFCFWLRDLLHSNNLCFSMHYGYNLKYLIGCDTLRNPEILKGIINKKYLLPMKESWGCMIQIVNSEERKKWKKQHFLLREGTLFRNEQCGGK